MIPLPRLETIISCFVSVHPHEIPTLIHSFSCFFFILSAYFVILPLRDEGAISLGLNNLPGLFVGSLVLTLVAAPVSTILFSLPNVSKRKALFMMHRFFSVSLVLFFILWYNSSSGYSPSTLKVLVAQSSTYKEAGEANGDGSPVQSAGWGYHGWFYISVRVGLFLWVALLNLVTISSTWARVIDVMDSESGSRLFGFVGAGATLGQLFGSLFAAGMARLGPFLLLFAALLMELAAHSSKGINHDVRHEPEELSLISEAVPDQHVEANEQTRSIPVGSSPKSTSVVKPQLSVIFDGLRLIVASNYLLYVCLFLWLSAVVSSVFYFQKVTVIAATVASPLDRRRLFAEMNSFIAIFILAGQLTITVVTYVLTRPGRELLFSVVSQDEKYKAKVCIDVIVQRLGDATAAGIYKLLSGTLHKRISEVSLCALPVCFLWIVTAFHLGRQHAHLVKLQAMSTT